MTAANRIPVRVDARDQLTADLAGLAPALRKRALTVIRVALRDLDGLDPPGGDVAPREWEAAWARVIGRRAWLEAETR